MPTRFATRLIAAAAICSVLSLMASSAVAQFTVTNGNFSDLSGLGAQGGGWYSGLPTGWSGVSNGFAVLNTSGTVYAANVSQLATTTPSFFALNQAVGNVAATGPVTLKFDIVSLNASAFSMGAAIWADSTFTTVLANAAYNSYGSFELTAPSVAAGTPITVGFWTPSGQPGVTNVAVVPEPSTLALLGLASGGVWMLRRRRR